MQIATFHVDDELFAVPVLLIEEFFRPVHVTPVPLTDRRIAGLINLRGKSRTVLDMRSCLGKPADRTGLTGKMIMMETQERLTPEATELGLSAFAEPIVLQVDQIDRILTLDPRELQPPPAHLSQRFLDGVTRYDDRYITLVNFADLIEDILHDGE